MRRARRCIVKNFVHIAVATNFAERCISLALLRFFVSPFCRGLGLLKLCSLIDIGFVRFVNVCLFLFEEFEKRGNCIFNVLSNNTASKDLRELPAQRELLLL